MTAQRVRPSGCVCIDTRDCPKCVYVCLACDDARRAAQDARIQAQRAMAAVRAACDCCARIPALDEAPVLPGRDGVARCLTCWVAARGGVMWLQESVDGTAAFDWRTGMVYRRSCGA